MLRLLTKMNRKTRSNERRETTRADLRSTAALFEKVGEKGVRNCDAVGLHHRGPHLYRRVRGLGRMDRIRPSAFFHSRHSYLSAVAALANVGGRNRCGVSMEYAEGMEDGIQIAYCASTSSTNAIRGIQQSGRGKNLARKRELAPAAPGSHKPHACSLRLTGDRSSP